MRDASIRPGNSKRKTYSNYQKALVDFNLDTRIIGESIGTWLHSVE